MSSTDTTDAAAFDHDVVVVGGGPAGCAAGVFTARYGLDTMIFDRGRSSIQRCAYLENYLGFPRGSTSKRCTGCCTITPRRRAVRSLPTSSNRSSTSTARASSSARRKGNRSPLVG